MTLNQFQWEFKNELVAFMLTDEWWMFYKPLTLWNERTLEKIRFKKMEDALDYTVNGVKVWDIIKQWDKLPRFYPDGGRGAGSGTQSEFSFNHASDRGGTMAEGYCQRMPTRK